VLVEVRGGGLVRAQTFFANALAVRFLETHGQVAVTEPGTASAAAEDAYVKVFARLPNGKCASTRTATPTCAAASTTRR
jgi:hypothetical protein